MSKNTAGEKSAKHVPLKAPRSVKIAAGGNKATLRAMAEAHAAFEEYRRSGFKGSWWNKSEGKAEKSETPRIRCGGLIRTGRAVTLLNP